MNQSLRIVLGQIQVSVGDLTGNVDKIIKSATEARDHLNADVILFPELSITGYSPEDLLRRKAFITATEEALQTLLQKIKDIYVIVGYAKYDIDGLKNVCAVLYNGKILATYAKRSLPNYAVFDEKRYFIPGSDNCVIHIKDIPIGLVICEDLWQNTEVAEKTIAAGAKLILSMNASPFEVNKDEMRQTLLTQYGQKHGIPFLYTNLVGGQDELVFDGGSLVVNEKGKVVLRADFFHEALLPVTVKYAQGQASIVEEMPLKNYSEEEKTYACLVTGLRDYIRLNGFSGVLLGISGGIDSALTAAIAVDALAPENVHGVLLPSRYTSEMSFDDAIQLINHLNISHETISIEPSFEQFLTTLALTDKPSDITQENLQARCRAIILMALSNQTGKVLLSTSNHSELAMGYGTLYGDMAGGFNVLKDVPKTWVYRLARYRNQHSPVIPDRIIEKAPTAELRHNQKDEDSLPPYDILDKILALYVREEKSIAEIVAVGFSEETVRFIANTLHKSEYKRRQGCTGIKIFPHSFGRERRYPITYVDPELT